MQDGPAALCKVSLPTPVQSLKQSCILTNAMTQPARLSAGLPLVHGLVSLLGLASQPANGPATGLDASPAKEYRDESCIRWQLVRYLQDEQCAGRPGLCAWHKRKHCFLYKNAMLKL